MAFMVPLVKNHYDIYARNNPADHHNNGGTNTGITGKSGNLVHDPASNSLILSATSLGKSGAPVKKQYRIILSGGQVVTNGNGGKKKVPGGAGANFVTANGKAYYRMPSASISLPVNGRGPRIGGPGAPRRSSKSTSEAGGTGSVRSTPTSPEHRSNSSNGSSPGSPPHYPSSRPPHSSASICQQPTSGSFRRTSAGVRSPQSGNRLYSYSVSIPEDEEKKVKESLNSLLADKENLVDQESQLEDDQLLAIFATSAPGGTGALEEASLVKPPPSLKMMKKKMAKKPLVQKSASLNAASPPPPLVETKALHHSISPSSPPASPTSSPPASPSPSPSPPPPITTTSREYVELLRKFILHLKMLKIGSSSSNNNNNSSSKQRKQSKKSSVKSVKSNGVDKEESELSAEAVADDAVEVGSSEVSSVDSTSAPKRARKRKDTMEDSKDL